MHGPLRSRHAPKTTRMLRPTDTLRAEHSVTSLGLSVLAGIAAHLRGGGAFPADDVAEVLRFLREFVQAVHLRKESECLYPGAAMAGDEAAAAMVGELMRLHDEVGDLLHALVLFWEPSGDLLPEEQCAFAATAATLAARVERMQQLEENALFPACDASVPADDQLDWNRRFAELERDRTPAATWQARLTALAQRWHD